MAPYAMTNQEWNALIWTGMSVMVEQGVHDSIRGDTGALQRLADRYRQLLRTGARLILMYVDPNATRFAKQPAVYSGCPTDEEKPR